MDKSIKIKTVILARGGSKGIPLKNIALVNGNPLISYCIKASLDSNVDETWVSTDSDEIANVAKSYGVKERGEVEVRVGTSSSNSHVFLKHKTTHKILDNGDREYRFYVDVILIKRALLPKGSHTAQFLEVV